ncbi:MAG: TonB-dependent receptor [Candidatus Didemnitutus sp.]|nr:TonB-dependent receptor [Candidatus Didemnitutus sp.]
MIPPRTCTTQAALRRLYCLGVAVLLSAPGFALAQAAPAPADAAKDDTVKLDKFVVTGSLIPIAADTPAVPITVMTANDIANSGLGNDLTDVMKKINPFFFGRANLGEDNGNTRAGGTNGASTVSLRNRSTLVLINGRRAAISPVAAAGGGTFVDVSLIPISAVERIEVLNDGASATYGTDAVSGVVNIILKTNFRGVETGGGYTWSPNASNRATRRAFTTFGIGNEKTQVTVSAEWRSSDPLYQFERPWGKNQFRTASFAGVISGDGGATFYYLKPGLNAPPQNLDLSLADLVAQGIYTGPYDASQIVSFFDLSQKATMAIKTIRRSGSIALQHQLTSNVTAFADMLVTNSYTMSSLNAQPVTGNVVGSNANNPTAITLSVRNRFVDFPRLRDSNTLGLRSVFGLKGSLGNTWTWEAGVGLNRSTQHLAQQNLIDTNAYNAAVANGTYNPFARVQAAGVIEQLEGNGYQDFVSQLISFDVRASGEIFQLPAGALQLGLGAETRSERTSMVNDRNDRLGLWLQATPTLPFSAKQSVDGFSAELRIPVFGGNFTLPGFKTLEIGLAGRKELYTSTTDPFVPKYSVRWMPFNDEFVIRGTYGESFTAPTLFSLFGPSNSGFTNSLIINRYDSSGNLIGPSNQRQYRSRGGSNPNLIPSQSRNWTAGFVWSPRALKGFSLTVDWFNIDERDLVGTVPSTTILQSVEQFGPASPYANQIRLGTSVAGENHFEDGARVTGPGQITSGASDAVWLTNPALNIAGTWQDGADVRLDYHYDTKTKGRFNVSVSGTYIHSYVIQNLPTTAPFDFAGSFSGTSTYPTWRTFTQLEWTYQNWILGASQTLIPSIDDQGGVTVSKVGSYQSYDFRASYSFKSWSNRWLQGLRLTVGVNNAFDRDPPFIPSEQDQGRDINTYDMFGRTYFVSATYKF